MKYKIIAKDTNGETITEIKTTEAYLSQWIEYIVKKDFVAVISEN